MSVSERVDSSSASFARIETVPATALGHVVRLVDDDDVPVRALEIDAVLRRPA